MDVELELAKMLKNYKAAPFLFIGSGFSRRYLGLEDWKALLRKFCTDINQFEYYYSSANSDLPKTASLISKDFSEFWWKDGKYANSRTEYSRYGEMLSVSSPLKFEISKYLETVSLISDERLNRELEDFKKVSFDGIITTNWDCLLESVFFDYDVYIGQSDLINSIVQEINEIYKIHGSIKSFNSLVLTNEDYDDFNEKNLYLAAKLLSIFIEHPIVFIGYSISDTNIKGILKQISNCISENGLKNIEDSLFLIEPIFNDSEESYERTYINIDSNNLPITIIKVKNYSTVYRPLQNYKRKLSVKLLKQIKSQVYEIVKNNDPQGRIGLMDFNDDTDFKEVDFVLGVGAKHRYEKGLIGLEMDDFIEDIIFDNRDFNPKEIIEVAMPKALKNNYRTPFFKYLRKGKFYNSDGTVIMETPEKVLRYLDLISKELNTDTIQRLIRNKPSINYAYDLINPNILKASIKIRGKGDINIDLLEQLLKENFAGYMSNNLNEGTLSNYRTIARIYDWLKFS